MIYYIRVRSISFQVNRKCCKHILGRMRDDEGLTDEEMLGKIWRSFYMVCNPSSFVFLWPIFGIIYNF